MKKLIILLFFLYSLQAYAQTSSGITDSRYIDLHYSNTDTAWKQTIEKADLVMKVKIEKKIYMTFYGGFSFSVLELIKGKYQDTMGFFELGLMEFTQERFEKRYRPVMDSNVVYIGFLRKTKNEGSYALKEKGSENEWVFFMSSHAYIRSAAGRELDGSTK